MLDQALSELADLDQRQSSIVEMCYFGGLDEDEAAGHDGIPIDCVERAEKCEGVAVPPHDIGPSPGIDVSETVAGRA